MPQRGMACAVDHEIDLRRDLVDAAHDLDVVTEHLPSPRLPPVVDDGDGNADVIMIIEVTRNRLANGTTSNNGNGLHIAMLASQAALRLPI